LIDFSLLSFDLSLLSSEFQLIFNLFQLTFNVPSIISIACASLPTDFNLSLIDISVLSSGFLFFKAQKQKWAQ